MECLYHDSIPEHRALRENRMRVCVTGATGQIGGALIKRLLAEGSDIQVLARASTRADELETQRVQVIRGDLSDETAIESAINGAEVVYHIAAKVSGAGGLDVYVETNCKGTQRVFEASVRQHVRRVIYLSSIAVYGLARPGDSIDEDTPLDSAPEQRDLYSRTKIAADEIAISYSDRLPVTIIRPGIVYGPGRPLPLGLLAVCLGQWNLVFANKRQRFPLNYLENLVDAILLAGKEGGEELRQYIVVDDADLTLERYHKEKSEADGTRTIFLPGWPVLLGGSLGGIPRHHAKRALQDRKYDTRRIREGLGWKPRIALAEAIRQSLQPPCV